MNHFESIPRDVQTLILLHIDLDDDTLENLIEVYSQLNEIVISKNYWIRRLIQDRLGDWYEWIVFPNVKHESAVNQIKVYKFIYHRIAYLFRYSKGIYNYLIFTPQEWRSTSIYFNDDEIHDPRLFDLLGLGYTCKIEWVDTYKYLPGGRQSLLNDFMIVYEEKSKDLYLKIGDKKVSIVPNDLINFLSKLLFFNIKIYEGHFYEDMIEILNEPKNQIFLR